MTQSDFLILTKKIAPAVIDFVPVLLSGGWEFPLESSGSRLEGFHVWDYFFLKKIAAVNLQLLLQVQFGV